MIRLKNPFVLLLLQAIAFWPVWRWYAARITDSSDDAWGWIALATAGLMLARFKNEWYEHQAKLWLPALLTLGYAFSFPFVTPLLRALIDGLHGSDVVIGHLVTTQLDAEDTLRMVGSAFGFKVKDVAKSELLVTLEAFLLSQTSQGKRCLLIVDEAQNLDAESLEEIRLLTNVNADEHLVMQLLLVGQPELHDLLKRHELRQLAQRIGVFARLGPHPRSLVWDATAAGELFEVAFWVIDAGDKISADRLRVALHGQFVAVLVKDLSPGVVTGAFSVNDEAVEVEDDGAKGGGHGR